jgi:hypothetical protein
MTALVWANPPNTIRAAVGFESASQRAKVNSVKVHQVGQSVRCEHGKVASFRREFFWLFRLADGGVDGAEAAGGCRERSATEHAYLESGQGCSAFKS